MPSFSPVFSPLMPIHQDALWHFLHVALWDPPPAGLRPLEILQSPHVRIYAEDWGRASDVGVIARLESEADPIGACWMRCCPDGQGLAYVDEHTPQLGIALLPPFQRRGYGKPMMMAALQVAREHGYQQVSLTVHPANPAIGLYESCGFRKMEVRNSYHMMLASLS